MLYTFNQYSQSNPGHATATILATVGDVLLYIMHLRKCTKSRYVFL